MLRVLRAVWLAAAVGVFIGVGACGPTGPPPPADTQPGDFVGSAACQSCHADIYGRWEGTLMANVLQDPRENPDAILADFDTPHELVTFTPDEVTYTYGSRWKQRYFTRRGDDLYVFPAQWDVQNREWHRYFPRIGGDWWTEHYPEDPMQRPTGPLCDGCHSVDYDIADKSVTEWNVGCEACHGPGGAHLLEPVAGNVVNPTKLDAVRADDLCIQCHSQGQPPDNPIDGTYYDWPVGFRPGDRLSAFWELDGPHLGEETFTHWPEGSAHKNRMQGNDYVQSQMYVKGVRCYACHDVHGTEHPADLVAPGNDVCTECHQPQLQAGPAGSLAYHTQHEADGEGSQCVACHMPSIARTIGAVTVRSHTFRFISPTETVQYGMPNACNACHDDETPEWAIAVLADWPQVSPWRVAQ
jgi:predicted CXXCH cytochrome family protein